jgi:hypothetical protein
MEDTIRSPGGVLIRSVLWVVFWSFITCFAAAVCASGAVFSDSFVGRLLLGVPLLFSILMLVKFPLQFRKATETSNRRVWLVVCTEVGVITSGLILFGLFLYPPEITLDRSRCEAIARAIKTGNLFEPPSGTVDLSVGLADATCDGKVYVTHKPAGDLYVFKTMHLPFSPRKFRGYIYSTVPQDDPKMHQNVDGIEAVEVRCWADASTELLVAIQPTDSKNWLRMTSWQLARPELTD